MQLVLASGLLNETRSLEPCLLACGISLRLLITVGSVDTVADQMRENLTLRSVNLVGPEPRLDLGCPLRRSIVDGLTFDEDPKIMRLARVVTEFKDLD